MTDNNLFDPEFVETLEDLEEKYEDDDYDMSEDELKKLIAYENRRNEVCQSLTGGSL